ncbi:MAG: GerMN domain-containing protein [Eubacteriaceae bacterium]|nr:GerMN domain-containing protein [Eubacteriaceae bacterium]
MKRIIPLLLVALILYGSYAYLKDRLNKDETNTSTNTNQPADTANNSNANNDSENSDIPANAQNYFSQIVYYSDSNGYLVPVLRKLPKNASLAKTTLSAMYINKNNRDEIYHMGLVPTIPDNISITLALKEDGLIKVAMSDQVMNIKDRTKEEIMLKSIVYTLTEFDNISKVQFLVNNAQAGVLSGGAIASGTFLREDINAINSTGKNRIILYYSNTFYPGFYVYPVTVYIDSAPVNAQELLNALIANNSKVKTNLNIKSENIASAIIKDKKAKVELKNITGDSIYIECLRKCIALTLEENFELTSAEIIINGESKSMTLPIAPNEL